MSDARIVNGIAIVALALAALLAGCGGSEDGGNDGSTAAAGSTATTTAEDGTSEAKAQTIVVRDGEPVGGIQVLEYSAGEAVSFEVRSDVADEIHVHGYDVIEDVKAGGTVSFDFPADIEGIFEVELEGREEQIAELRVNP